MAVLVKRKFEPIEGPVAMIPLHPAGFAIVDKDDFDWLSKYRWKVKKSRGLSYVVRTFRWNGRTREIKMHREISCPMGNEQTHHKNHNTFDNRRINLENLTRKNHDASHGKGL